MTTIAFDGNELAVDRQATTDLQAERFDVDTRKKVKSIFRLVKKLHLPPRDLQFEGSPVLAVTGSGHAPTIDAWRKLLFDGKDLIETYAVAKLLSTPFPAKALLVIWTEDSFWEIIISKDGITKDEITSFPYVRGSGGMAALAMMKFVGLTATDAVIAACACDPGTGGFVDKLERRNPRKILTYGEHEEAAAALIKNITYKPPKTKIPAKNSPAKEPKDVE